MQKAPQPEREASEYITTSGSELAKKAYRLAKLATHQHKSNLESAFKTTFVFRLPLASFDEYKYRIWSDL